MPADRPPSRLLPCLLLALGAGLLALAYTLPTVTYSRFAKEDETFSIYGGVQALWNGRRPILGAIVFVFSIVFPIGKLVALLGLLARPRPGKAALRWIERISLLGKWSMVDVFVIGGFVGAMRLGIATGTSRAGIHVFTAAVVLSMLAAVATERWLRGGTRREVPGSAKASHWVDFVLPLVALVAQIMMLCLPFFQVRVKLFFSNEVGPYRTTSGLLQDGEWGLAAGLIGWVWGLPALRAVLCLVLRMGHGGGRLGRLALRLDEWSMVAVFALGLTVVWVKLVDLASTTLQPGFWVVLVAAALGELDAWMLRRDLSRGSPPEQI